MHDGYTYTTGVGGPTISLYLPPGCTPPDSIDIEDPTGRPGTVYRLSDRSLGCDDVPGIKGHCTSYECHRVELGACQCKRHGVELDGKTTYPIPFERAPR